MSSDRGTVDLSGRRVLVTGAGGFIGSRLSAALVRAGATSVRGLCRYTSSGSRGALIEADPGRDVEVVFGDVREPETLVRAADSVDVIFHLAAHIGIPWSYESPRDVFDTNTQGTLNVCQAARALSACRVVHVSTSEVYGEPETLPITERHPIAPRSPYAASKAAADHLVASFVAAYGLDAVTIRPFNTYGPGQSTRAVLPTIITQALAGGTIRLGAQTTRRDLTYVDDTVGGLMAAVDAPAVGDVVQLGSGTAESVAELVDLVAEALGRPLQVETSEERLRPARSEISELRSDPSRARDVLGWEATTSLRDGIAATVAWFADRPPAVAVDYAR